MNSVNPLTTPTPGIFNFTQGIRKRIMLSPRERLPPQWNFRHPQVSCMVHQGQYHSQPQSKCLQNAKTVLTAGMDMEFTSISPKSRLTTPLFQTMNCSMEKKNRAVLLFYFLPCLLDCKHPKDIVFLGLYSPNLQCL